MMTKGQNIAKSLNLLTKSNLHDMMPMTDWKSVTTEDYFIVNEDQDDEILDGKRQ